jgi:hypothetical protein
MLLQVTTVYQIEHCSDICSCRSPPCTRYSTAVTAASAGHHRVSDRALQRQLLLLVTPVHQIHYCSDRCSCRSPQCIRYSTTVTAAAAGHHGASDTVLQWQMLLQVTTVYQIRRTTNTSHKAERPCLIEICTTRGRRRAQKVLRWCLRAVRKERFKPITSRISKLAHYWFSGRESLYCMRSRVETDVKEFVFQIVTS